VSSAVVPFSEPQLLALLEHSCAANTRVGVTGLLLYSGGNFVQALEGSETAVRAVYARIAMDSRHRGCITLIQEPIAERSFGDWSMAFRNLDSPEVQSLPGYSDYLNYRDRAQNLPIEPSRAWQLLASFRSNMR
jgi:hypothetical protein